jgi:uncharacterized iron-regulated membrane protein
MYDWMKKIHMYAGLLSFMAFVVWGVTGTQAVFLPKPGEWQPPPVSGEKEFRFESGGNLDDKTLAKAVFQAAELAMVGGYYNVHRDDAGNLAFLAYSANGQRELTYLEKERRVRVVFRDSGLGDFLSSMHANHSRRGAPDRAARLWGYYNEFSTWAFLFMVLSGIYLWVATRPGLKWALILGGAMIAATALLWVTTR